MNAQTFISGLHARFSRTDTDQILHHLITHHLEPLDEFALALNEYRQLQKRLKTKTLLTTLAHESVKTGDLGLFAQIADFYLFNGFEFQANTRFIDTQDDVDGIVALDSGPDEVLSGQVNTGIFTGYSIYSDDGSGDLLVFAKGLDISRLHALRDGELG
jgi:hypothetical protein